MLTTYGICTLADTNKVCRSIPSKTNTAINLCDTTKIYNLPISGIIPNSVCLYPCGISITYTLIIINLPTYNLNFSDQYPICFKCAATFASKSAISASISGSVCA